MKIEMGQQVAKILRNPLSSKSTTYTGSIPYLKRKERCDKNEKNAFFSLQVKSLQ